LHHEAGGFFFVFVSASDETKKKEFRIIMEPLTEEQLTVYLQQLYEPRLLEEDGTLPQALWNCHHEEWKVPMAPTVSSTILPDWDHIKDFIEQNIQTHPFVKTCEFSPKDVVDPPVFTCTEDAIRALKNSLRTKHMVGARHIIMKARRNYVTQARCFWASDQLRVVCGNMAHELVLRFFDTYKWDIPYHYCCVELGQLRGTDDVEVIELNSFSVRCDPAPLSWSQDWYVLFFAQQVHWCDV
jgi:hypothetical protein